MSQGGLLADLMTQERICFVLSVSRNNLINGTLSSLVSAADAELKKPLRVSLSHSPRTVRHTIIVYRHLNLCGIVQ